MIIGLAQINTTVGDIQGNSSRILDFLGKAKAADCDLLIFPEMCVIGYPPRDLVEKQALVRDNLQAIEEIAARCLKTAVLVGFVDRNHADVGKSLFNAAALLADGRVEGIYHKSLLPTYDVFDEGRYFEPGGEPFMFERGGLRFGVTICEDIWGDQASLERQIYRANPLDLLTDVSLDYLVNIAASPFSLRKEAVRLRIATRASSRSSFGVIYVNLVGGNDELIFDGGSFVMDRNFRVVARSAVFREDLIFFDTARGKGDLREEMEGEEASLAEALALGLRDYVTKCGFEKVILGLSGGIDSAVTAVICTRALGPGNVIGMLMPSGFTGRQSVEDATVLAKNLGIQTITIPISDIHLQYLRALDKPFAGAAQDATEENLQARIRGNLLMAMSNKFGWLLVNTGNKSELAMGYCTLYGDMTGGLSVLGDVPKTMVYPLGRFLNTREEVIPERIFTKAPSAELRPGQKDEDSLPPYAVLDPILRMYIEENLDPERIVAAGHPAPLVYDIVNRVDQNEYKRRQAPPVLRVTSKAFGMGRRLPIAQNHRHHPPQP